MSHVFCTAKTPGYTKMISETGKVRLLKIQLNGDGVYAEVNGCVKFVEKFGFGCQGRFSHAVKPVSFL